MTQASSEPQLPGGAALAPGELVLLRDRFRLSTVAFYLHTELALTNRRLYAMRPNTFFGVIPIGTDRKSFPVDNIAGIEAGTRLEIAAVILGILGLLVGLAALAVGVILGLLLLLISALVLGGEAESLLRAVGRALFGHGCVIAFSGSGPVRRSRPARSCR